LPGSAQPEEASVADEESVAGPICPEGVLPSAAGEPACEPPAEPGQTRLDLERLNGSFPPSSAEGEQRPPSDEPKATEGGAS